MASFHGSSRGPEREVSLVLARWKVLKIRFSSILAFILLTSSSVNPIAAAELADQRNFVV
jgi:hypothetical protein